MRLPDTETTPDQPPALIRSFIASRVDGPTRPNPVVAAEPELTIPF